MRPRMRSPAFALVFSLAVGQGLAASAEELTLTPTLGGIPSAPQLQDLPQPADLSVCRRASVYSVDSANLERSDDGATLSAEATVTSSGWSDGRFDAAAGDDSSTVVLDLMACRPDGDAAQVLSSLSTRQALTIDISSIRTIIIRAETNSQTLNVGN